VEKESARAALPLEGEKEKAERVEGGENPRRVIQDEVFGATLPLLLGEPKAEKGMMVLALAHGATRLFGKGLEELALWTRRSPEEGAFFALYALAHPRFPKYPPKEKDPRLQAVLSRLAEVAVREGVGMDLALRVLTLDPALQVLVVALGKRVDGKGLAAIFHFLGSVARVAEKRMAWLANGLANGEPAGGPAKWKGARGERHEGEREEG
jgi:hypothetical protein